MANQTDVFAVLPQIITVPNGITLGVFVGSTAGQVDIQIRNYTAGATLIMLQANAGSTMPGATLAAISATFAFSMDATTTYRLNGPANFYLAASGATATVNIIRGMGQGF